MAVQKHFRNGKTSTAFSLRSCHANMNGPARGACRAIQVSTSFIKKELRAGTSQLTRETTDLEVPVVIFSIDSLANDI